MSELEQKWNDREEYLALDEMGDLIDLLIEERDCGLQREKNLQKECEQLCQLIPPASP